MSLLRGDRKWGTSGINSIHLIDLAPMSPVYTFQQWQVRELFLIVFLAPERVNDFETTLEINSGI